MEDTATEHDQPLSMLDELLGAVPKLAQRTLAQVELSRALLGHLPCVSALLRGGSASRAGESDESGDEPTATTDTDHPSTPEGDSDDELDLRTGTAGIRSDTGGDADGGSSEATGEDDTATAAPAPPVDDLAIPGYDSLAASQVVPRLTTLSSAELDAVRAYETAHRHRQTILNRVTQLLAG